MNLLNILSIGAQPIPAWQRHRADQAMGNTLKDVHALQRSASLIKWVTPEMSSFSPVTMTRGDKAYNPWYFTGTWASTLDIWQFVVAHGRMINDVDDREARNVCVIGTAVRDALFGSPDEIGREIIPVGEFVNINNQRFRIIGMYAHNESELDRKARELAPEQGPEPASGGPDRRRGGGSGRSRSTAGIVFESKNNSVHIPLNTMKLRFRANASAAGTPEDRLASITERTREIGIRKAIGATFFGVFIQVLAESVVIAALGGLAGLLASQGLVNLLSLLSPTDFTPVITAQAMALAFSFSVGVGILAGLFPGFKAARLSPIQALRYE